MHVEAVTDPLKSSEICDTILRSLPEWFAVEASAEEYAEAGRGLPFFAACQGNRQRWTVPPHMSPMNAPANSTAGRASSRWRFFPSFGISAIPACFW